MKTLAIHIGMFGAARLESTPLIEWAKDILMTQQVRPARRSSCSAGVPAAGGSACPDLARSRRDPCQ
jgi:hypothetical protein